MDGRWHAPVRRTVVRRRGCGDGDERSGGKSWQGSVFVQPEKERLDPRDSLAVAVVGERVEDFAEQGGDLGARLDSEEVEFKLLRGLWVQVSDRSENEPTCGERTSVLKVPPRWCKNRTENCGGTRESAENKQQYDERT